MKISIWQQFSSNHSGFFWVVGTFEQIDDAENAFNELREMLFTIDRWHREHETEMQAAVQSGNVINLFPPEQAFAEKFKVDWPMSIDWTNWANYYILDQPSYGNYTADDIQQASENLIDKAVQIVGRNVIVSSPDQTWMTTQPFEGILAALGAQTIGYDLNFIESEASKDFGFHTELSFTAPDQATADHIEREVLRYIAGDLASIDNPPPWHDDEANYQQVLGKSKLLKREHVSLLKQNWQRRFNLFNHPPPSPYGLEMPVKRLALRQVDRQLERDGERFVWTHIWFHNEELGASAMIAWLEVNGCFDIDYSYVRD